MKNARIQWCISNPKKVTTPSQYNNVAVMGLLALVPGLRTVAMVNPRSLAMRVPVTSNAKKANRQTKPITTPAVSSMNIT